MLRLLAGRWTGDPRPLRQASTHLSVRRGVHRAVAHCHVLRERVPPPLHAVRRSGRGGEGVSHRPAWNCDRCHLQLGEEVQGVVIVWVPRPAISPDVVAVECPRCRRPQVWTRQSATTPINP